MIPRVAIGGTVAVPKVTFIGSAVRVGTGVGVGAAIAVGDRFGSGSVHAINNTAGKARRNIQRDPILIANIVATT